MVQIFEQSDKGMNILFNKYKGSWFVVGCLVAIVAIIACNLWLLCWGHCVINDFLRIHPIGWLLIGANLVAGLVFFVIKNRKNTKHDESLCAACHTRLRELWVYCPKCGGEHGA